MRIKKDINEVMENGDAVLSKEKARASCHLVRTHSWIQKKMTEHALLLFSNTVYNLMRAR